MLGAEHFLSTNNNDFHASLEDVRPQSPRENVESSEKTKQIGRCETMSTITSSVSSVDLGNSASICGEFDALPRARKTGQLQNPPPMGFFTLLVRDVQRKHKEWQREALKRKIESNLHMLQQVRRASSPENAIWRQDTSLRLLAGGGVSALLFPIETAVCGQGDLEWGAGLTQSRSETSSPFSESPDCDDSEEEDDSEEFPVVLATDSHESIPRLLNKSETLSKLRNAMPLMLHYRSWSRIYSLERDGDSFGAFLRCVKGWKYTLLVVETTFAEIIGGFADVAWDQGCQSVDSLFFGTGQSFLFSIRKDDSEGEDVQIFPWRGCNQYMQLCRSSDECVAMGGGGDSGTFGLCIQDNFTRGSSGPCETFGNLKPLTRREHFNICNLEVYGFVQPM